MEKIIFTIIHKYKPITGNAGSFGEPITREISSTEFKNLPAFFKKYIEFFEDKSTVDVSLTVDPVIDIKVFADAVSKCFNLVYMAQNNLTNAHNILVNLHKELLRYAKIHNERAE